MGTCLETYAEQPAEQSATGFYIQSCPKMRYKGEYSPSFLVDPETQTWYPLEMWRPLLDKFRYVSISHPENSIEGPYAGPSMPNSLLMHDIHANMITVHEPHVPNEDLQGISVLVEVKRGRAIVTPAPVCLSFCALYRQRCIHEFGRPQRSGRTRRISARS